MLRLPPGGARAFELCEPFGASFDASYCVGEGGRHVLVVGSSARAVYHADAEAGELYMAASLYRRTDEDYGLLRPKFAEAGGRLLVVYEGGIACLDPRAGMRGRWRSTTTTSTASSRGSAAGSRGIRASTRATGATAWPTA